MVAGRPDGLEVGSSISRTDPEFSRPVVSCLKKENRVVFVSAGTLTIWDFPACEFGYLSNNSAVEAILWSSFGHVSQHFYFAREPCVASPLDVTATNRCSIANTSMVPMANARLAQSEMRQAALRMIGLAAFEDISDPSQCLDQRLAPFGVDLAAETVNVNIDHIRVGLNPHPPYLG